MAVCDQRIKKIIFFDKTLYPSFIRVTSLPDTPSAEHSRDTIHLLAFWPANEIYKIGVFSFKPFTF